MTKIKTLFCFDTSKIKNKIHSNLYSILLNDKLYFLSYIEDQEHNNDNIGETHQMLEVKTTEQPQEGKNFKLGNENSYYIL